MTIDPRQLRTRAALISALHALLSEGASTENSLEAISVAKLCATAGVHRTTFYKHAASIEEFAVDAVTRELDDVSTVDAGGTDPLEDYRVTMIAVLDHVAAERTSYRALLGSPWSGALREAIDERMRSRVWIALDVFAAQQDVRVPDHRTEITAFVSGGLVGAIMAWALSDDTDSVACAARIQALMPEWWPVG